MTLALTILTVSFGLAVALEALWARFRKVTIHTKAQVLGDVTCGVLRLVSTAALGGMFLGAYTWIRHWALFTLPIASALTWLFTLLGLDLLFYFSHRMAHRSALLWLDHAVHHQGRDFNLLLGLRHGAIGAVWTFPFYLPLALVGVPPEVFFPTTLVHSLAMFWLHARFVPKLGAIELIVNTPSHHRVHHGRGGARANFGALLIVWDRLFGTFAPETAVSTLPEVNPGWANDWRAANLLRANVQPWLALGRKVQLQRWARSVSTSFLRGICRYIGRFRYRLVARGLHNIPETGAVILVANHVSFIDWLFVATACPRPVRFVTYYRFMNHPVLGFVFRWLRVIPIAAAREAPKVLSDALEEIARALGHGEVVCIMPEGEVTRDGKMHPFRPGIEWIVRRTPVAVVPIFLDGMWGSFFSRRYGHAMSRPFCRSAARVRLTVGEPVPATEVSAQTLAQRVALLGRVRIFPRGKPANSVGSNHAVVGACQVQA